MEKDKEPVLRIIHFNDFYDIQPIGKNGEGGVYYFKALLDQKRNNKTLTLFSGEAFSPSILSTLFHGWHMVQALQQLKIDAACFGNHEFDFEIEHTESLARSCEFPWLLGNLIDKRTQEPLGGGHENIVLTKNNLRVGVFGVAE
jgi:5'-nucleotidase